MPTYNCQNCGQKHGTNDACGRGQRIRDNLRAPLARFGEQRSYADPLW